MRERRQTRGAVRCSPTMIWSTANLRALEGITVGHSEVVYAFVSLEGEPSALDEALLDDEERRRPDASSTRATAIASSAPTRTCGCSSPSVST